MIYDSRFEQKSLLLLLLLLKQVTTVNDFTCLM